MNYTPSAGQTHIPASENINIDFPDFQKPAKPSPLLPELILRSSYAEKGFALVSQKQHFLPGVDSEMMDWFWVNMEKGYYLWAPGSHKLFTWVKPPCAFGLEESVHCISESVKKGQPVFGGEGVEIHRLRLKDFFPYENSLKHVIIEGVLNDKGEIFDTTTHMWEDTEGGLNHITATVVNTRASEPPAFLKKMISEDPNRKIEPNYATDHEDFEASQWPVFLPRLYDLWKNHPDPSQSVHCSMEVRRTPEGSFDYLFNL